MVVACIALVVALGGSAYAVTSLPDNSVGTKQLRDRAVTRKKIEDGAVVTSKIKDGAVTGNKLAPGVSTRPSGLAGGALAGRYPSPTIRDGAVSANQLAPLGNWSSAFSFGVCAVTGGDTSWAPFGLGYANPGVRLDAYGVAHLRGAVGCPGHSGNVPSYEATIMTLDPPYQPLAKENFPVTSSDGAGDYASGVVVEVDPDGTIQVAGPANKAFISLAGIQFDTHH